MRPIPLVSLLAALAVLLLSAASPAVAEDSPGEVKAKFVIQLLKYVTWPEAGAPAGAPFVVGVVGDESFAAALTQIAGGKEAQGRPVQVRALADGANADGIHLLYLGGRDPASLREVARSHHGQPVLTVADRFEFAELGGDVGLELVGGRVSFSINRRKSVRGDLVISSKLMRLASEVK
jgi:hypothetical protein